MRTYRAFTVWELLIVLAIVVVVALLAIPSYQDYKPAGKAPEESASAESPSYAEDETPAPGSEARDRGPIGEPRARNGEPRPPAVGARDGGFPNYAVVEVFYATDRAETGDPKPARRYGGERGTVAYGTCQVSIPRDHRMGELEAPSIWRLEFREDPEKHVVLLDVVALNKDEYFSALAGRVQASPDNSAFIFLHGYNVTFEAAARRTAQMSYDLGFAGAPVFYSWPSQGTLAGYPVDETNVQWTQTNLRNFLEDFTSRSTAQNIFLIAHSMGNRALTQAYSALIADRPELRQRFREVILTAPDIDAEIFQRDIAPKITGTRPSVTLYASSKDKALMASKRFHGYPRAGDSGDGLIVLPGIETVDATHVESDFLGHSYAADTRSVLSDMFYLIRNGMRADQRFMLEPVDSEAGRYWRFKE